MILKANFLLQNKCPTLREIFVALALVKFYVNAELETIPALLKTSVMDQSRCCSSRIGPQYLMAS